MEGDIELEGPPSELSGGRPSPPIHVLPRQTPQVLLGAWLQCQRICCIQLRSHSRAHSLTTTADPITVSRLPLSVQGETRTTSSNPTWTASPFLLPFLSSSLLSLGQDGNCTCTPSLHLVPFHANHFLLTLRCIHIVLHRTHKTTGIHHF
jgi:hypothetical protein